MKTTDTTAISMRLPRALYRRIKAAADAEERTVSQWIRYHLARILDTTR